LQTLADSGDPQKRAKGRRGLEFASRLQRNARLEVTIDERPVPGIGVDQMLIELARLMPAFIVTTDVALAQVAKINDIAVLNINDLANAIKTSVIPGQIITVSLIREGEQPGQAVGFLSDGTMVVAEDGGDAIGQTLELMVTSSLQTSAGRLIFARIGHQHGPEASSGASGETPAVVSDQSESPAQALGEPAAPKGPFPPTKAFRPTRPGTPRNPRR